MILAAMNHRYRRNVMNRMLLIALCGLVIAGCATENRERSAGGATAAPASAADETRDRPRPATSPSTY
jgi:hypothetical protein